MSIPVQSGAGNPPLSFIINTLECAFLILLGEAFSYDTGWAGGKSAKSLWGA